MVNHFKGYDVVDAYPEDGWLKGYFYARENDIKGVKDEATKAYRDIAYIRHKDYVLHLLDIKKGERVLDIGCADGAMMIYCGLLGAEIYGIDLSSDFVEKANRSLGKFGIRGTAVLGDAKRIDFPENYFDKVVSSDFFEHLNSPDNISVLKEIKRVLKPGGVIIVKTPNLTYLRCSKFFKQMKRILQFKNPFDVIISHTVGNNPQHIGLVRRNEMARLIKSAGFSNFRFHFDINSKVERFSYSVGEFLAEAPILRDIFTEDIIAVIYKPIILSFFP